MAASLGVWLISRRRKGWQASPSWRFRFVFERSVAELKDRSSSVGWIYL